MGNKAGLNYCESSDTLEPLVYSAVVTVLNDRFDRVKRAGGSPSFIKQKKINIAIGISMIVHLQRQFLNEIFLSTSFEKTAWNLETGLMDLDAVLNRCGSKSMLIAAQIKIIRESEKKLTNKCC